MSRDPAAADAEAVSLDPMVLPDGSAEVSAIDQQGG
jgi:hypothetical protein